jgi:Fe-Mn family superoxide dismutase
MTFKAKKMEYPYNALEPFMPAEYLELHYEKHHIGYANKLKDAIKDTSVEQDFDDILDLLKNYQKIEDNELKTRIREFGGGLANHDFF